MVSAVNTRSIIDPDVAVKLSGKRGRNSFGVLATSDNGPGNLSEGDREFVTESPSFILGKSNPTTSEIASVQSKQAQLAHIVDKNALIGIVRLKRDILSGQSYLGFLGTSYNFAGTNSQLAGLDGLISINRQTTFSWQALGSTSVNDFFFADTGNTQHQRENGLGYAFDYNRNGRHLVLDLSGIGRTQFFRTAVGFQTRVNYNREGLLVQYTTEPKPRARIISFRIYDNPSILFDWQGWSHLSNNEVQATFNLQHQAQIGVGLDNGYERLLEEEFGAKRQSGVNCVVANNCTFAGANSERSTYNSRIYAFGSVTPNKQLRIFFTARTLQNSFDFDFGAGPRYRRVSPSALAAARATQAGSCSVASPPAACNAPLDPGPGKVFSMNANIDYRPATPLDLNLDFTKQRLRRNDTGLVAFDENVLIFKTTYQLPASFSCGVASISIHWRRTRKGNSCLAGRRILAPRSIWDTTTT